MKYSSIAKGLAFSVAAVVMGLGSTSVASDETPSWCGPKQATLALRDGYGGNSWRQVTTASGKQTVELCPSKYEYADGQGDTQKSISDIKSDLFPWNVLGLRLVCSPEKETENEAFPFQRRADHRYSEGALGRAFGC